MHVFYHKMPFVCNHIGTKDTESTENKIGKICYT